VCDNLHFQDILILQTDNNSPIGCSVFVYCVIVFTAVIFAKSNSPICNCNDTVVNWFIKEKFCNLRVWFMFITAINPPPFFYKKKDL
jgi:hypothetical protein